MLEQESDYCFQGRETNYFLHDSVTHHPAIGCDGISHLRKEQSAHANKSDCDKDHRHLTVYKFMLQVIPLSLPALISHICIP